MTKSYDYETIIEAFRTEHNQTKEDIIGLREVITEEYVNEKIKEINEVITIYSMMSMYLKILWLK